LGAPVFVAGSAATLPFEVRNTGGTSLVDLPVRASARRQLEGGPIALIEENWNLAPGEVRQGTLTIPASAMSPGGLVLILSIPSGISAGVLDYRAVFVADNDAPIITPLEPLAGAIVSRDILVEARVLDTLSQVDRVEVRLDSSAFSTMAAGPGFAGQYRSLLLASADGPATLQIRAQDTFGNIALSAPWSVVVDSTPPQIQVTGITSGGLYSGPITPQIDAQWSAICIRHIGGGRWPVQPVCLRDRSGRQSFDRRH
jgi:hypothetical protein